MENSNGPRKEGKFWSFMDRLKGDKVVWIIVFLLIMISLISIFASTSLLNDGSANRLDILKKHFFFVAAGIALILLIYHIGSVKLFKNLAKWGFLGSFALLLILAVHPKIGEVVTVPVINGARRFICINGFQIHVFEIVKVAIIMYLAWAINEVKLDAKEEGHLKWFHRLAGHKYTKWLEKSFWKNCALVYGPVCIVVVMTMMGSNSAALFIAIVCFIMLFVGGMPFKEYGILPLAGAALLLIAMSSDKISGENGLFPRMGTLKNRLVANYDPSQLEGKRGAEFDEIRDNIKQPYGAKIAVHQGRGILGKGIGHSTQKYTVTNIYGDFMFSFIIEETGILGALFIIMIYVSLLARGSLIAKNLDDEFAKYTVGGLCMLISLQAFLVMSYNVDMGPMTGQTLPLVSHGSFAFLIFSIAFGVILSLSKLANENIRKAQEEAEPIYEHSHTDDEVRSSLDDLEQLDSI